MLFHIIGLSSQRIRYVYTVTPIPILYCTHTNTSNDIYVIITYTCTICMYVWDI